MSAISAALVALALASPSISLELAEPKGANVQLLEGFRRALTGAGWTVVATSAKGPGESELPHCALRGTVDVSQLGRDAFAKYDVEVVSESGVSLAHERGQVDKARPADVRAQVINRILSKLTATLTGHAQANHLIIDGVVDDAQVTALRTAVSAVPGVERIDDEHFSNGQLTFTVASRRPAQALAEVLATVQVGELRLALDYAGVDTLTARLR